MSAQKSHLADRSLRTDNDGRDILNRAGKRNGHFRRVFFRENPKQGRDTSVMGPV